MDLRSIRLWNKARVQHRLSTWQHSSSFSSFSFRDFPLPAFLLHFSSHVATTLSNVVAKELAPASRDKFRDKLKIYFRLKSTVFPFRRFPFWTTTISLTTFLEDAQWNDSTYSKFYIFLYRPSCTKNVRRKWIRNNPSMISI